MSHLDKFIDAAGWDDEAGRMLMKLARVELAALREVVEAAKDYHPNSDPRPFPGNWDKFDRLEEALAKLEELK